MYDDEVDDDDIINDNYGDTIFIGPCTCGHDKEEHGWFGCDECDCDAYWEAD